MLSKYKDRVLIPTYFLEELVTGEKKKKKKKCLDS